MMAAKVFISYRRDDSAGTAGRVNDRLEREFGRDRLFMDVDSIPLGVNFVDMLSEEVAKCDVLLAVIGPNWLNARDEDGNRRLESPHDFVRIEIGAALQRNIPVIPILLDGAKMPKANQLPKEVEKLSLRNGLDVRHASFHNDIDKLVRNLQRQLTEADARRRDEDERRRQEAEIKQRADEEERRRNREEERRRQLVKLTVRTTIAQPWREIGPCRFRRDFEVAADPVFDLVVENTSGGRLVFLKTGIRILQRKPGIGGMMGYAQPIKVQAKYSVHCHEDWKRFNLNDNESWANFRDPMRMEKDDSPFRFTLRLENFCDTDSASSSEIRFCLQTSSGTVESESIWLEQ
jgi:hypothetical protein